MSQSASLTVLAATSEVPSSRRFKHCPRILFCVILLQWTIPHMAKNSKAVLIKPSSVAQTADREVASPAIGAPELPVLVASVGSLVAVAVTVHTIVCVVSVSFGGNQLAKAGWKS